MISGPQSQLNNRETNCRLNQIKGFGCNIVASLPLYRQDLPVVLLCKGVVWLVTAAEVVPLVPGLWLLVGLGKGTIVVAAGLGEGEVKCGVLLEEVVSVVKVVGVELTLVGTTVVVVVVVVGEMVGRGRGVRLTGDKEETFQHILTSSLDSVAITGGLIVDQSSLLCITKRLQCPVNFIENKLC